jgi:hypothetical protein
MSEELMALDVYERLMGDESVTVCREVPMLGRFIDLAYIKGRTIVTIEFKLNNWKRAIQQARDHKLGADFAYICMPKRTITDRMREEVMESGVGLKFYCEYGDWPFEEVISAPRSKDVWKVARASLRQYVKVNRSNME